VRWPLCLPESQRHKEALKYFDEQRKHIVKIIAFGSAGFLFSARE
jgi:CBS domain containing-hemolysin-like protein